MIRSIGMFAAFFSAVFFPWPFTAFLALGVAFFEPWMPLATGLFIDTLYYTPHAGALPIFTFVGAFSTGIVFFVRSRLKASIIEG